MEAGGEFSIVGAMENDMALWSYWGFEPWSFEGMRGVKRLVTFVKPALIGDIAKYYAEDTIIWCVPNEPVKEKLWRSISPKEDTMTQRFLFIERREPPICRVRSFLLGFRGYLEFHSYWPQRGGRDNPETGNAGFDVRLKDLVPLVDRAMKLLTSDS